MIEIDPNDPLSHKPLVERESVRILRRRGDLIISQTKHGFVCANAGIDLSNVNAVKQHFFLMTVIARLEVARWSGRQIPTRRRNNHF